MIRDLPFDERPRERLLTEGAEFLSNAELLAILLRTGTKNQSALQMAQLILKQTQGLKFLNEMTIEELMKRNIKKLMLFYHLVIVSII